jgi:hypothetical protein
MLLQFDEANTYLKAYFEIQIQGSFSLSEKGSEALMLKQLLVEILPLGAVVFLLLYWFKKKIQNTKCKYYILTCDNIPVGSIRFDIDAKNDAQISYLIDPKYQGKKLGNYILKNGIKKLCSENKPIDKVYGYVMKENLASVKAFEKLNFNTVDSENQLLKFTKIIAHENS